MGWRGRTRKYLKYSRTGTRKHERRKEGAAFPYHGGTPPHRSCWPLYSVSLYIASCPTRSYRSSSFSGSIYLVLFAGTCRFCVYYGRACPCPSKVMVCGFSRRQAFGYSACGRCLYPPHGNFAAATVGKGLLTEGIARSGCHVLGRPSLLSGCQLRITRPLNPGQHSREGWLSVFCAKISIESGYDSITTGEYHLISPSRVC